MIKVLFFAQLREVLQTAELQLDLDKAQNIAQLIETLVLTISMQTELSEQQVREHLSDNKIKLAHNQQLLNAAQSQALVLSSGDEVAFFPPVTGG